MAFSLSVTTVERRARYVMGAVALLAAAGLGAFKMGWISTTPPYKANAWYLVENRANFIITKEFEDEMTCRRKESGVSVCRTGKALLEDAQRDQSKRT